MWYFLKSLAGSPSSSCGVYGGGGGGGREGGGVPTIACCSPSRLELPAHYVYGIRPCGHFRMYSAFWLVRYPLQHLGVQGPQLGQRDRLASRVGLSPYSRYPSAGTLIFGRLIRGVH
jgi:hypothetical protein